jgi:trk system potassium uptake protein TrkH
MRVIIIGIGRIGRNLAKSLAQENNEVYLIEKNEQVARKNAEKLDAKVIIGNGADPYILKKANVREAQLVLAVSPSDEINLVACSLAGEFGAQRCIARVRNTSLSETLAQIGYDKFNIDEIINPELVAAQAIQKIVEAPGASEVADFADGKIFLRAFNISSTSPLCGLRIGEFRDEDFPWPFLVVSVVRNKSVLIPKGDTVVEKNDRIYVLLPAPSLGEFLTFVNPEAKPPKKIVIYGATITGTHAAQSLAGTVDDILLIEEDEGAAAEAAGRLEGVRIINGSASARDILTECGIEATDVFIATSKDDHANLVSSMLAKKMGAKATIIMAQHEDYMPVVSALDIDAIISPHYLAGEKILHLVRGKGISAVTKLLEGETEALEFIPEEGAAVTKGPLKTINFPKNSIVGAVYSGKEVVLASGDVHIKAGERVIVKTLSLCSKEDATNEERSFLVHKRFIANIVSRICLIVCFIMTAPLAWAIYDDYHSQETKALLFSIFLGIAVALAILFMFPIKKKDYQRINAKDGLAIVGLSWICLSFLGALPIFLSGVVPTFTDAFFETTSGFTTTGATVFADVESLPRGILFWRSLTHWLGGMGIIVLYIALLPALGTNAFQLYKAEAPGITAERIEPQIKETAKNLWGVYFLFTFLEILLLMAGKMPVFDAMCHTFGTMATGGFSTKNASIGAYSPYIQWVVIIFMFLAGMNFVLHYQWIKGRPKALFKDEEFRRYATTIGVAILVFAFVLMRTGVSDQPLRDAAFQITSILTTTGYTTADFDLWPHALRYILVLLMFVGGCGGSTGGGMKVVRVLLSLKVAFRSVVQTVFPNAVMPIRFNSKSLSDKLVMSALSYFVIFVLLFSAGTTLFLMIESCDLVTALSATIAALSNIGPGLARVGATQNYAWVSLPGKWLLTFLMLSGRLELYSILIFLVPSTWKK